MELVAPIIDDMPRVLFWRSKVPESLRTPFMLTCEMQEDFYKRVVCNRKSAHRYWSIIHKKETIGFGGLTNIQWENSIAEISLIINPEKAGQGYGKEAVDLLLDQAFNKLNLKTVFGEYYLCNPAVGFWRKIIEKYDACYATLNNRKFWNGEYYSSIYFSIDRDDYESK